MVGGVAGVYVGDLEPLPSDEERVKRGDRPLPPDMAKKRDEMNKALRDGSRRAQVDTTARDDEWDPGFVAAHELGHAFDHLFGDLDRGVALTDTKEYKAASGVADELFLQEEFADTFAYVVGWPRTRRDSAQYVPNAGAAEFIRNKIKEIEDEAQTHPG